MTVCEVRITAVRINPNPASVGATALVTVTADVQDWTWETVAAVTWEEMDLDKRW